RRAPAKSARRPRRRRFRRDPGAASSRPDETAANHAILPGMAAAGTVPPARRAGSAPAMDLDVEALKAKLAALKTEHRDLDDVIARLAERLPFDQLQLQRLKKRKLLLKDQISKIESELLPDIIA